MGVNCPGKKRYLTLRLELALIHIRTHDTNHAILFLSAISVRLEEAGVEI